MYFDPPTGNAEISTREQKVLPLVRLLFSFCCRYIECCLTAFASMIRVLAVCRFSTFSQSAHPVQTSRHEHQLATRSNRQLHVSLGGREDTPGSHC